MLRRSSVGTLALALLAAVAMTGCGTDNPEPKPKAITEYVAIGDSYTAVAGYDPSKLTDNACLRSDDDYPALLAKKLGIDGVKDVSCGGATSKNLFETQRPKNGLGSNPPQAEALNDDVKLVTVGLGLNDAALSYYLLYLCLPVDGKLSDKCQTYLDAPSSLIVTAIKAMGRQVRQDLNSIRKAAPKARIVLVGYPRLVAEDADCDAQLPLPNAALVRVRNALVDVNVTLRDVAKRAEADYIDMYAASEGHDLCSVDPWVNGVKDLPGKAYRFHPYDAYHLAVADKITALVGDN